MKRIAVWVVWGFVFACGPAPEPSQVSTSLNQYPTLAAVSGFQNPGGLAMYEYVPSGQLSGALVVALHGCTQSADAYQRAGWTAAADAYGFVVLYPQETSQVEHCFQWWSGDHTDKNGESLSIANAIQAEVSAHHLDARRVYVTGLSAGAAMTAVMLADYPDKGTDPSQFSGFAGGHINAGLPYRSACTGTANSTCPTGSSFGDAYTAMNPGKTMTAPAWGDRVRSANPNNTVWPRVSIWQGASDTTVATVNLTELMKQWTDVWGVGQTPSVSNTIQGASHAAYADSSGQTVVETYSIPNMQHGTAIDPNYDFNGNANLGCGTAGAYILSEGICSTAFALSFWGEVAAPVVDGGVTRPDAGPAPDAGPRDAGSVMPDAGVAHDAGTPSTCTAASGSNYAHVQAGRAHDTGGNAYTNGSNEKMGLDNTFYTSQLYSTVPGVWHIGACP